MIDVTQLPFNRLVGVERSNVSGALLALGAESRYTNHLGTVHAGALLALAEATSGEYLIATFADIGFEVVPVVRRFESKFKKPAIGGVYSTASVPALKREEFRQELLARSRSLISVGVSIFDAGGLLAMTASVEWLVAKKI